MTSESKQWDSLKTDYLRKVAKALSSAKYPRRKEVLEDVRSHLDRRFAELEPQQQTWENFQAIITEMGPASDYAELLQTGEMPARESLTPKYLLWVVLAAVVIVAAAILLPLAISPKVGYIVSFQPVAPYQNITATELLNEFNKICPHSVRTHHYRTRIQGSTLVGFIVVDTEEDKASIWNALIQSKNLTPITARAVTQKDLEKHYAMGQPSLKKKEPKKDYIPATSTINENGRIVDKVDYPFVNDPKAIGTWKSVDFIANIEDFKPGVEPGQMDLYLKEMVILNNGRTNKPWWTWTKDLIFHSGDKTAAKYHIKKIGGSTYMFFEWKSGDYTIRHMKPSYYVLSKLLDKDTIAKETTPDSQQDAINAAIDSAHAWLKLVDDRAYDQSWQHAAAYFKNAVSKEQLIQSFDAVRRPLGKVISRSIKSKTYTKQAPGAPDGQYVIIQFETSFENKTSAIETITPMLDKDGSWRVSGYYIK